MARREHYAENWSNNGAFHFEMNRIMYVHDPIGFTEILLSPHVTLFCKWKIHLDESGSCNYLVIEKSSRVELTGVVDEGVMIIGLIMDIYSYHTCFV